MNYDDNSVYGFNLPKDETPFPDNQKYGFIIYGTQKSILSYLEEMYESVIKSFPNFYIERYDIEGKEMDLPSLGPVDGVEIDEDERKQSVIHSQQFYITKGFNVGPIDTKTNREWIEEAFGEIPEGYFGEYEEVDPAYEIVEDTQQ